MISEPDYSYLGSGHILIREYGSAAPFLAVGNCSTLDISPKLNTLQLADFTNPGGGTRNRVDRITDVEFKFNFHDFHGENFARFLRGVSTDVVSGTVTDKTLVAYKGGWTPFAKYAATITNVEPVGGGTAYAAGTDYELDNGGIFIPSASTIPAPAAGAANCQVTYTYDAHTVTEALLNSAKQYALVFVGLNEARSGKGMRVTAHKVTGGVLATLGLLGTDYGGGEVSGSLLPDSTKGAGLSKYLQIVQVA
jgi:hypothetical protein